MIATDGADSPLLRSPGRMNSSSVMRITADVDGMEASALLALCDGADAGYKDSEDAVLLLSSDAEIPLPYTIAGNRALSLNATPSVEGTEVGLAANEAGRHVSLRFSNVPENLALYDALSGEFFPLSEDTSYEADGNIAARLYIVSADRMAPDMAPGIKLTVDGDVVTAIAPGAGSIGLTVYDLSGKCVASVSSGSDAASVCGLAKGFYLATASVGNTSVTEKIIVR